ncbi:MAG: thiamine-phosphate kinase [Rhizobiales bacterium PAR1]|nr:MAG: thiamine-phosphate kinase [Rhizobiales bacterium PAR1]
MSPLSENRLSEFDLIASLFAPMAGEGALGLLDDAAVLTPSPGMDLVVTKDALVEGVHFFADDPPASIARKALRVNLSDLAAKGATPRGFLLALGRGPRQTDDWLKAFATALAEDSRSYAVPLLGGDTVKAAQGFFSITAFGEVPQGQMVKRQGGKPGDLLYVSGTIGDAALGLKLRLEPEAPWAKALAPEHRVFLADRYLHPQSRIALASVLLVHASAAMDISDGLVGDADKLAARLGRNIEIASLPLSPAVRAAITHDPVLLDVALTGGDDYEILAAVPPENAVAFENEALRSGIPVVKIGTLLTAESEVAWLLPDGSLKAFGSRSYKHF